MAYQDNIESSVRENSDSNVTAIIEEVIERVRIILDQFEQVVDEVFKVIEMIRAMFREVMDLFTLRSSSRELAEYEAA